jgi:hypothetical protein
MAKDKKRKRHGRVPPGTPHTAYQSANKLDLSDTDPWPLQAGKAKEHRSGDAKSSISKPTPLTPGNSSFASHKNLVPAAIGIPQDHTDNPTWIRRQLAEVRNSADRQPSFYGITIPDDDNGSRNATPTPNEKEVKEKRKKKGQEAKVKNKMTRHDEAEEAKRQERKKRVKEEMERQTARALAIQAGQSTLSEFIVTV